MKKVIAGLALLWFLACPAGQPVQIQSFEFFPNSLNCVEGSGSAPSLQITANGGLAFNSSYTYTLNSTNQQIAPSATFTTGFNATNLNGVIIADALPNQTFLLFGSTNTEQGITSSILSIKATIDLKCVGGATLNLTLSPATGIANVTLQNMGNNTIIFNDSSGSTTPSVPNLLSATYKLIITPTPSDRILCDTPLEFQFEITQSSFALVSVTSTQVSSCANNVGSITVTDKGGTPPYTYFISDPSNPQNNQTSNPTNDVTHTFQGFVNGTYAVGATDSKQCNSTPLPIQVQNIQFPSLSITKAVSKRIFACTKNPGSITVTVQGGTPGYIYRLTRSYQSTKQPDIEPYG